MDFDVAKFIAKVEQFANGEAADRQDKTDGKLDDFEKTSLFNNKELTKELAAAVEKGEISEIDANEIFGFKKSEIAQYKQTTAASKTSAKMMQDDVTSRIFGGGSSYFLTNDGNDRIKVADSVDFDTLVEDLKTRLIGNNVQSVNKEYYTNLLDQVSVVADTIKKVLDNAKQARTDGQAYDSRDDVLKLYDQVKKELKIDKNDEFADFKESAIKNLMFIIEKHQIAKEEARVNDAYKECRKTMSREQAVEALKTKFKGSYYESFSNSFGSVSKGISHKGLLKDMENGTVLEDARQEVMNAVWAQRGTGLTTSGDVEDAAKKSLGKNNDKYTAKIFRGELSFAEKVRWERSSIKDFRKAVAAYNRVEQNKKNEYTEKQMTDVVKDNKVFTQLVSDGSLISKNKNGTYNIANLADLIRDAVSFADYRANYQTKDNSTLGEIESVMKAIKIKTNVDISRTDAKRLIDFCGFDRDKKNILMTLYNGTIGGLAAGVSSLVTALTVSTIAGGVNIDPTNLNSKLKGLEFPITITSQNDINFNLDVKVNTIIDGVQAESKTNINTFEIMRKLAQQGFGPGEAGYEILEDGTFRLWISKSSEASVTQIAELRTILGDDFEIDVRDLDVDREPDKVSRSKAFFLGLAVGMALSILSEALKELPGEKAVLTTDYLSKTPEEYERELSKEKNLPAQAREGLRQITEYYYKLDGNLDRYHEFMRKAAGGSSVLNKNELLFAIFMKLQEIKSGLVEKKPEPKPEPKQEQQTVPQEIEYETWKKDIPAINYTPGTVTFTAWKDLVNGYDCLNNDKYNVVVKTASGKNVILNNRMVKILQAIDLTKVSSDAKIQDIYNLDKIAEFARKAIETDIDTAIAAFPDFPIDKQKYNDVVYATGGVKGDVVIPGLYDEQGTEHVWKDNGKSKIKKGGKEVVTVATTTRTVNGETHYYKRVKGSDSEWTEISKTEFDKLNK